MEEHNWFEMILSPTIQLMDVKGGISGNGVVLMWNVQGVNKFSLVPGMWIYGLKSYWD